MILCAFVNEKIIILELNATGGRREGGRREGGREGGGREGGRREGGRE